MYGELLKIIEVTENAMHPRVSRYRAEKRPGYDPQVILCGYYLELLENFKRDQLRVPDCRGQDLPWAVVSLDRPDNR
jgi:hypothetical protein